METIITTSPYICAPNILDVPEYVAKTVELDLTGTDCIKAGSPISADGKVANDETAIGILLTDCHACLGVRRGQVVIDGRIKQDVAAAHSGITISDGAKAALVNVSFTGDGSRMGGASSWNDLTDKPFGEMPTGGDTLTWDGDTTGLFFVNGIYRISETTPMLADVTDNSVTLTFDGGTVPLSVTDVTAQMGGIESYVLMHETYVIQVFTADIQDYGILKGIYVGEILVMPLSLTIPGYTGFPTVKKLDAKYLPETKMAVNVVPGDTFTADKSYAEIYEALTKGIVVVAFVGSNVLQPVMFDDVEIVFSNILLVRNVLTSMQVVFDPDGGITGIQESVVIGS